jgi:micrococcal nuclease
MAYPIRKFDYATIVNVVDGDTCDIEIDLGFSLKLKQRFRLERIDTPERGQPGWQEAKDFLSTFIGKPIEVFSTKQDKYGRYLADLYFESANINDMFLEKGLAKLYGS